jgi:hypothetical protein
LVARHIIPALTEYAPFAGFLSAANCDSSWKTRVGFHGAAVRFVQILHQPKTEI